MKCKNCGYNIETVEQFCPQCGFEVNKKKKFIKLGILITIPLILILFITISLRVSLYKSVNSYDQFMSTDSDFSLLSDITLDQQTLELEIPINTLNSYMNQRRILKKIEAGDFTIKALCLDERNKLVYFTCRKSDGRDVDITASYTLNLLHNQLSLDINPTSIGGNPIILGHYMLGSKYSINHIDIPFDFEANSLQEEYTYSLLSELEPTIKHLRNSLTLKYSLTKSNDLSNLISLSDLVVQEPEIVLLDGNKTISHNSADLLKNPFSSDKITKLLSSRGYKADFYASSDNHVVMSLNTDFDIPIILDLNLELRQTAIGNIRSSITDLILPNGSSSEYASDELLSIMNDYLKNEPLGDLYQYTITSLQQNNNIFTFSVEQTSWTIMVYMNGSDLESRYDFYTDDVLGSASDDLAEMIAGLNSDNINLIIETGGTYEWKNPLMDASQNQRWKIEDGELHPLMDVGLSNMTHPSTLTDFCNWSIKTYPSEKYALLLWDHGGGSLYGFGVDEYFYGDSLTLDEIEISLSDITETNNMSFDIIGFDACLMATLETAVAVAPYADYLIASEETEPAYGWDYEGIFSELADGDAVSGKRFGELVVEGFMDYSVDANQEEMLTLSVIQLNKIPNLVDSMNTLLLTIQNDIDNNDGYAPVARAIPQIKAFGGNTEFTGYTDHYDLENFAKKLTEYWPSEANKVITAIDSAVIYKASGYLATDAGGLSFYLPFYDLSVEDIGDLYSPVSFSDEYTQFIDTFIDYRLHAETNTGAIQYTVDTSYANYQLHIDEESLDYVSDVFLGVSYVFLEDGITIDLGYDAWIATLSDGIYEESFSFWPSVNETPIPVQVVYNGTDYIEYETPILLNGESAMLISGWLYDENRYIVFGARPDVGDSEGIVDRNTIDILPGDNIAFIYSVYTDATGEWVTEAADPYIVPDEGLEIIDFEFEIEQGYEIAFVIEDFNGNLTYTDRYYFTFE